MKKKKRKVIAKKRTSVIPATRPPKLAGRRRKTGIQKKKKVKRKTAPPATSASIDATVIGKLPSGWTPKKVSALASLAATQGGFAGKGIVSVKLVADPEMRRLNRMYRGKDKTTDVLSFSYKNVPVTPPVIASAAKQSQRPSHPELGDIVISMPQVTRQARTIDRSVGDEFALMIVHGVLHVLGHDHETLAQERRMFGIQHDTLVRAGIL